MKRNNQTMISLEFDKLLKLVSNRNKKCESVICCIWAFFCGFSGWCIYSFPAEVAACFVFMCFLMTLVIMLFVHACFTSFDSIAESLYKKLSSDEIAEIEYFSILKRCDIDNNLIIDYANEKLIQGY
ncbi:hypothetical protein [Xenorhabdus bovienii]|uniref:hypothetical protein n=1 Tax=Xenorhabdus bovienii TaxID=40576 RepID=UPI002157648C|nr:hypothetical protein [Xenorhabdus bovienii]